MSDMTQPFEMDGEVLRFRANPIVRDLLMTATQGQRMDLCIVWSRRYSQRDLHQFYQLLGYSVSGYGDAFSHHPKHVARIDKKAREFYSKRHLDQTSLQKPRTSR
jgi:hypothetical protein